ncbi:MAG: DNA (cytosine-5)-methyltransferase 1 [Arenicella sp.]|jgi:DNA (cytosine-5)-methyltransferase 1
MPTSFTVEIPLQALQSKIQQLEPTQQAVITHYISNLESEFAGDYREEAASGLRNILELDSDSEIPTSVLARLREFIEEVPFQNPIKTKFSFIDLFAGIGGFRLALQNLDGKCVFTSEWDKSAKQTYQTNFGELPFGDITLKETKEFIPEKFDMLCAGFPCQAFSIAGNRKGFSETRGTLFFDIEQIVEKHRPKVVFLENVKNLISHDKGKTFQVILEILEKKLGYKVFSSVLNSMTHANIPQNRERIFIVAFDPEAVSNHAEFSFPKEIPLTQTIHDLLNPTEQESVFYYTETHKYYPKLVEAMQSRETVYQWRRVYVRENKSNVCPTLTANMGTGGHNVPLIKDDFGIRKLTPRECFAFQGYPENYKLPNLAKNKLYTQAGNSVTMPLIERIGAEILKVLEQL